MILCCTSDHSGKVCALRTLVNCPLGPFAPRGGPVGFAAARRRARGSACKTRQGKFPLTLLLRARSLPPPRPISLRYWSFKTYIPVACRVPRRQAFRRAPLSALLPSVAWTAQAGSRWGRPGCVAMRHARNSAEGLVHYCVPGLLGRRATPCLEHACPLALGRLSGLSRVLVRAGLIATALFWFFAVLGDAVFSDVMQAEFASFQIFGGVVFLLIGLQFVFRGPTAIEVLRGESEQLAGAIAMPILIGPGTISASVIIGKRHDAIPACATVLAAVVASVVIMIGLKTLHDFVRPKREPLIQRYIEIAGRIAALFVRLY